MTTLDISFIKYLQYINKIIDDELKTLSISNKKISFDILDSKEIIEMKKTTLKIKQLQMKIGLIWQKILGNYKNFKDLNIGDDTGLDIINEKEKIIIELKNRTNTDNKSAKTFNYNKLSKFKKNNPEYTCVYGCINENTKKQTHIGKIKIIKNNNQEIFIYTGKELLKLVYKNNIIINIVLDQLKSKFTEFYLSY